MDRDFTSISRAACEAAAELNFVAPDTITPMIIQQLHEDLNAISPDIISPEEIAIFGIRTDILSFDKLAKEVIISLSDNNRDDSVILRCKENIRNQISLRELPIRIMTDTERRKEHESLVKYSEICHKMLSIRRRLRRGLEIIILLNKTPENNVSAWLGPTLMLLLSLLKREPASVTEGAVEKVYIDCSKYLSNRLDSLKKFVGIATIRAISDRNLSSDLQEEPLYDTCTRIFYRLKILSEQQLFDYTSFIYIVPLILMAIKNGGLGKDSEKVIDEHVVLSLEFLLSHAVLCTEKNVQRVNILETVIISLRLYPQHYKLSHDVFFCVCQHLAPDYDQDELALILRGILQSDRSVRATLLEAVDAYFDLSDIAFSEEIWLACYDDVSDVKQFANDVWQESQMKISKENVGYILNYITSGRTWIRRAAAKGLRSALRTHRDLFGDILLRLQDIYCEYNGLNQQFDSKREFYRKATVEDQWKQREGVAFCFLELAEIFQPVYLLSFITFLLECGPLKDRHANVRNRIVEAAVHVINARGNTKTEELLELCNSHIGTVDNLKNNSDEFNEAVVILSGAAGQHLKPNDARIPQLMDQLLDCLNTPSEAVQSAAAEYLSLLLRFRTPEMQLMIERLLNILEASSVYATQRGAAYGLAEIVKRGGIAMVKYCNITEKLRKCIENKKVHEKRQGAFIAYELLSSSLARLFEPYALDIIPNILTGFGDTKPNVREACHDASRAIFSKLSSFGVRRTMPILLQGLEEQQWRSKKGACECLGAMAYMDPQQLAQSLPDIIPPLTNVLNDSHKEVRASANANLKKFGEVVSNPEIKANANIVLKALSDPTKYTENALDSLLKVSFVHYIDGSSLAFLVPILERGLKLRSGTKQKASKIIGSLSRLTESDDLTVHLASFLSGLRAAIVDPVPATRATSSKAMGSLIEKLGEDAMPELIPSLMAMLRSDTGAGARLGSAQALSEILAGLGTSRLDDTLPLIFQNVKSSKPIVREGYMSLFIFLPACFGTSFAAYLSQIVPYLLAGLADDVEAVREISLRAGRLLVKKYSNRAVDLLLPELQSGLADDNYRIRLSSMELVGDLLYSITGINSENLRDDNMANQEKYENDDNIISINKQNEAIHTLLEILGSEKRNWVLSAIFICRCDTATHVRAKANQIWKTLVSSPRVLKEIIPTLSQLIVLRISSSSWERKIIASNALGELIRKAGEGALSALFPSLESELRYKNDVNIHLGVCIALREIAATAPSDILENYENILIASLRIALISQSPEVRDSAAEAFDALQNVLGKKAINDVIIYILQLLDSSEKAEIALAALLTLLKDNSRSNFILPKLLPTLLLPPISKFNAHAIASLVRVTGPVIIRKLSQILNSLMDSIIYSKEPALKKELETSFDTILLSVDENDGLNVIMNYLLLQAKADNHCKRALAHMFLSNFLNKAEVDLSRYYHELIRVFLIGYEDGDTEVVRAACSAMTGLTKRLRKEEMETMVISCRQLLLQVGFPGVDLPGFSLPKGVGSILPIFLQALVNGNNEQRVQAAMAISDLIDRTNSNSLQPYVIQVAGSLIRVITEKSAEIRCMYRLLFYQVIG